MQSIVEPILKHLTSRKLEPVYVFHGDEPYYQDVLIQAFENEALPVADRSFNQYVLYGKDLNVGSLLSYSKRFPMMAERQLVIVKDAQDIQDLDNKEQFRYVEEYLMKPLTSTVLVLSFRVSLDERKAWVKALTKNSVLVHSKRLYDNKIPEWIQSFCNERGIKISRKAVEMLNEYIGNDLKRLVAEIDKILLNLTLSQEITAEVVEKYVGISKEYNVFELQKSLIQRDILKANQIVSYFAANPKDNPIQPIILILYNYFSKLLTIQHATDKSERGLALALGINPFFVKDYIAGLRSYSYERNVMVIRYLLEADARSKGIDSGNMSDNEILRSLIFNILH